MGDTTIKLDNAIIHGVTDSVAKFLDEWYNDNDFIVAHTSGSTGTPKPIKLAKSDLKESALSTCKIFNIKSESIMVLPLSPDYIAGKMMIVRAIVSGATLWVEKPSNTPLKQDYGTIDLLPIVPSQIESIISNHQKHNIRSLIVGGGAIPRLTEEKLINTGIRAYATYGMTETCSHVALREIMPNNDIYKAINGISFSVDNRNCLIINPDMCYSYGRIITNDIVNLLDKYTFNWLGRFDNVINTAGIKVFPEQIEKALSQVINLPFYVIGTPDDKWGEAVTLYIESENINLEILQQKIQPLLDKYSMPKKIKCVKQFLRTNSGKIKRIAL